MHAIEVANLLGGVARAAIDHASSYGAPEENDTVFCISHGHTVGCDSNRIPLSEDCVHESLPWGPRRSRDGCRGRYHDRLVNIAATAARRVPYDANHTTVSRWLEGTVAREVRPGHRWLVHEPVSFQDEATCILQWEQEVGGVSAETQLQARLGHS